MNNELNSNHVCIDMKAMRENGIECNENALIHQEQLDEICLIIKERLSYLRQIDDDGCKKGKKFYPTNDVVSIFARRGAGKTTFVKTLIELIANDKLIKKGIRSCDLLCIDVIEPNQMHKKENFIVRFIASIQEKFESEVANPYKKDTELKDVQEELYEALPVIDGIGKMSLYSDWDDSDYLSDKYIKLAIKMKNLEQRFHKYISKILNLSQRKALLFILDDSDVNIEKTFDILETIRLFFTSPQVIVVMTGDLSLYAMAIRKKYWKFFDQEFIAKDCLPTLSADTKRNEYYDMVRQLEAQYLQKMTKAEHRIVLNTVYDKYKKKEEKENNIEKQYSIGVTFSNGRKMELCDVYREILKDVRIVTLKNLHGDMTIFLDHLLKQPFRNQYRLLSVYDSCLPKINDKQSEIETGNLAEGILKTFEVYINQSTPLSKKLMERSQIYAGWLMKFLIDNDIAAIGSHFLPTVENDTLNNALFALCIWCESQIHKDMSIAFDFLIRVSFIRQTLLILDEKGKELDSNVGICRDIGVHKILGDIHAYFNAKIKEKSIETDFKKTKYPYAGIFTISHPVISTKSGIEDELVKLIQLECISTEAEKTLMCSFYKIIASLAELLREYENRASGKNEGDHNWIKVKLNDISQFHTYTEPNGGKGRREPEMMVANKAIEEIQVSTSYDEAFVDGLFTWLKEINSKWITPQSLDRIFSRTYYTMTTIDSMIDYSFQNLGEKISNYIVAFWNACIVEEAIVNGNPEGFVLGYDTDVVEIFIENYKKFTGPKISTPDKDVQNGICNTDSFALAVIECPLLKAYVNPQIITIMNEGGISVDDYKFLRRMYAIETMNLFDSEISKDIGLKKRILKKNENDLLVWNEIDALEQKIELIEEELKKSSISFDDKIKMVEEQKLAKDNRQKQKRKVSQDKKSLEKEIKIISEEINSLLVRQSYIEDSRKKFELWMQKDGIPHISYSTLSENGEEGDSELSVYNQLERWRIV